MSYNNIAMSNIERRLATILTRHRRQKLQIDTPGITSRQAEVLAHRLLGYPYKHIGQRLSITERTVKNTLEAIATRIQDVEGSGQHPGIRAWALAKKIQELGWANIPIPNSSLLDDIIVTVSQEHPNWTPGNLEQICRTIIDKDGTRTAAIVALKKAGEDDPYLSTQGNTINTIGRKLQAIFNEVRLQWDLPTTCSDTTYTFSAATTWLQAYCAFGRPPEFLRIEKGQDQTSGHQYVAIVPREEITRL